jgi:hypothetical protein
LNPKFPSCDPCKVNPLSKQCCDFNPSHPNCDICKVSPGGTECC